MVIQSTMSLNRVLNDYVGGSFDDLPVSSKRLLCHCTQTHDSLASSSADQALSSSLPVRGQWPETGSARSRIEPVRRRKSHSRYTAILTPYRIHKGFQNSGYMHMCLTLASCQWAWVTGSMDGVRIPFLYHKAATYQFVREKLQDAGTAQGGDTMLAISALALAEVSGGSKR
jgi:hypothetical protein